MCKTLWINLDVRGLSCDSITPILIQHVICLIRKCQRCSNNFSNEVVYLWKLNKTRALFLGDLCSHFFLEMPLKDVCLYFAYLYLFQPTNPYCQKTFYDFIKTKAVLTTTITKVRPAHNASEFPAAELTLHVQHVTSGITLQLFLLPSLPPKDYSAHIPRSMVLFEVRCSQPHALLARENLQGISINCSGTLQSIVSNALRKSTSGLGQFRALMKSGAKRNDIQNSTQSSATE